MPVTAKLSKRFYDALGEDVANELVEWFNAVDTDYRQDLKDLNDANWGRVDARIAAVESGLSGRMDALESRFQGRMDALESRVDAKLEGLKSELLRWMFLFWVGTMGTVLAILKL